MREKTSKLPNLETPAPPSGEPDGAYATWLDQQEKGIAIFAEITKVESDLENSLSVIKGMKIMRKWANQAIRKDRRKLARLRKQAGIL